MFSLHSSVGTSLRGETVVVESCLMNPATTLPGRQPRDVRISCGLSDQTTSLSRRSSGAPRSVACETCHIEDPSSARESRKRLCGSRKPSSIAFHRSSPPDTPTSVNMPINSPWRPFGIRPAICATRKQLLRSGIHFCRFLHKRVDRDVRALHVRQQARSRLSDDPLVVLIVQ